MWSRGHKWQRCLWEVLLLHHGAAWPAHTPDHSPDLGCGHLPHCNPPLCTALRRLWQTNASDLLMVYMPHTHTHIVLTHIPHTHLTSSQTHLAHLFPVYSLVWYQAFLQHLQEKNWQWNVSCKSLWHISRQCSRTKKISFFLIIQPLPMHNPKIKFYLITDDFTVALPVTTKQIRKPDVIVGQFLHHRWRNWSRSPWSNPGQHHLHQEVKQGRAVPGTISMKCHAFLILNVYLQQGREAAYRAGHLQAEERSCFPTVQESHWVIIPGGIKVSVDVSLRGMV